MQLNDIYWGVASGSSHAAMRRLWEEEHPLRPASLFISYATRNNQLWNGPSWFVDSGGAPDTIKANDGHAEPIEDYIDYLADPPIKYRDDPEEIEIDYYALRDWPCEPDVREALDLSVDELLDLTVRDHRRTLELAEEAGIEAEPVAVLQGWEPEDYLECLDRFFEAGLVTDHIGIGSICRRAPLDEIVEVVAKIRQALPDRCSIHGFGVKKNVFEDDSALFSFDSADSTAWENTIYYDATTNRDQAGPPSGSYSDWIDWNEENGKPRYTGENCKLAFLGYLTILPELGNGNGIAEEWLGLDGFSIDRVPYRWKECLCGSIFDPGRPDPFVRGAGCRHCHHSALTFDIQRIDAMDRNPVA